MLVAHITDELRRTYFMLLVPAVVGFIFLFGVTKFHLISFGPFKYQEFLGPSVFIASVIFAIALPIFFRTLFAHKVRDQKSVSEADLVKFERNFLYIALVTPYVTLVAYLLALPRFYCAGTVLMALYAVYYYYPSERRIRFEKRIFRVR
ncbi:MAG: hypothetical protein JRF08_03705 [Deltaproteobacteria bacterium]|nr:hypothetical protein [Deltaproteobacteria bacterium]MCD6264650.1 hypothetical protein [Deltaproteobacteria bacterium]HDH87206.1 hypothetical protein [Desulfobacteraceae bacterium]